jgi:hypothetical protein
MSVYTVHEPPLRAAQAAANPERFIFVRDGFYFWAFVFSVLWMLWHRMWLVLVIYIAVAVGIETVLRYAGVPGPVPGIVAVLLSLLVGLEAGTLRRFTLARRGWKNVGIISAHDLEDAERRFFGGWVRAASGERKVGTAASPNSPAAPPPRLAQPPEVIGLFPEPGGTG